MTTIIEIALALLQTTQALKDSIDSDEFGAIEAFQQKRALLVAQLDTASRQYWPENVTAKSHTLVEQTRTLEKEIITMLTEKRDAIGREHDQLQRNQQARKAYGNFS